MSEDYSTPARNSAGLSVTAGAILTAAMLVLALIGAGMTLADVKWVERYWLWLVPVFGVLCTIAAWLRNRTLDGSVIRQVLHWLAVGIVIAIDFSFFHRSGEQTAIATGLSTLLLLSLGCLLAGVHLEWMFALVGLLLLVIAVTVSLAQEYMALVFVVGAALLAIVLAGHHLLRKWQR